MCQRGDIYYADLPEIPNSNLQAGYRPILILGNPKGLENSPVYQYIPITTKIKKEHLPVHVILNSGNLKEVSMILGEQIHSVDKFRLREKVGTVSEEDMFKIDLATICELGINIYSVVNKLNSQKRKTA